MADYTASAPFNTGANIEAALVKAEASEPGNANIQAHIATPHISQQDVDNSIPANSITATTYNVDGTVATETRDGANYVYSYLAGKLSTVVGNGKTVTYSYNVDGTINTRIVT